MSDFNSKRWESLSWIDLQTVKKARHEAEGGPRSKRRERDSYGAAWARRKRVAARAVVGGKGREERLGERRRMRRAKEDLEMRKNWGQRESESDGEEESRRWNQEGGRGREIESDCESEER